jgi:hypothetical protein
VKKGYSYNQASTLLLVVANTGVVFRQQNGRGNERLKVEKVEDELAERGQN